MKQNKILLFILAFATVSLAKMPDQIKPTRNFTSDSVEIATPVYKIGELSDKELVTLQVKHPGLDIETVRFYIIDNSGAIKPFQFKVDKTKVEVKTDHADLAGKVLGVALLESLNTIYSSGSRSYNYYSQEDSNYRVISPMFYYGNDFEDVRQREIKEINKNKIGATFTALFGGFLAGTAGVIAAQSIKNNKWDYQISAEDALCAITPASVSFSAMIYQMYSEQAERYLQITKREYLQIRKLYPEIDCESFSVTHPIKNAFLRGMKYFGASAAIAGVVYLCKSYMRQS